MIGVLHTARINAIEVIVSSDKLTKMVNFKLGVREVMGSIPVGDSIRIFFCPTLVSRWLIHLHISLPSLKFTIFINLGLILLLTIGKFSTNKKLH